MHVQIERFKNLASVNLELGGLTLLVGGNNAGKSSVLQAIQFGVSVAQTSAMQGGIWADDRLATSIGQSDLVYSPIKDVLSLGPNGRLREPENEAISITYSQGGSEAKVSVRKGRNKNVRFELIGQGVGQQLQSITSPFSALVTGLAGIPSEEEFETNIVVRKAAAKGDSNSVFRNILLQLKSDPQKWFRFQSQIRRIFPEYDLEVTFNPDADETIRCTVQRDGIIYPIDSCGTGVLQAIQIFSYINLFEPKILLLDEPDSHLHPNNQKQLAQELITAADSGLNVVVSTHSRHLVEALWENARLVWLKEGAVQPNVEDYEIKALLEIGALNVGERLGNPRYIFLTEDKDQNLFGVLLESNGYDIDECDIVSYSGCTQIGTAIALISHLRKTHGDAQYVVHRDRDFLSEDILNQYREKFARLNVAVFIPEGNDIEAFFVKPEHIAVACGIEEAQARQVVQAAYEARKNELTAKYVNTRVENMRKSGQQPNAGDLAVECNGLMVGPEAVVVHGKILMKGVRDVLHAQRIPDRIVSTSAALRSGSLRAFQQV
ncbi:ATP-dependent nuclease [Achromobacter pulmonis]|uniref:ATP-dependent nuclease n=1 Tax=Achromobacter pulmonis TaxID=1389932 RepID=UPI001F45C16B|nr:AAA family ATPase [Achromobacter pulmonis]MCF7769490.1 AAA family ATPase [Achromobacter pulmonis]